MFCDFLKRLLLIGLIRLNTIQSQTMSENELSDLQTDLKSAITEITKLEATSIKPVENQGLHRVF